MELLLTISACKEASARKVKVVMPYFGYSRQVISFGLIEFLQHFRSHTRAPISAADIARMMYVVGCDQLLTVDLHAGQIEGYFDQNLNVEQIHVTTPIVNYLKNNFQFGEKIVVVAPDSKDVTRYGYERFFEIIRPKHLQDGLLEQLNKDVGYAALIRSRDKQSRLSEFHVIGDVKGADTILIDDILDTGVIRI